MLKNCQIRVQQHRRLVIPALDIDFVASMAPRDAWSVRDVSPEHSTGLSEASRFESLLRLRRRIMAALSTVAAAGVVCFVLV